MQSRTVIADSNLSIKIENLRNISYHNATGFKIKNEKEFEKYYRWGPKDQMGLVLVILNEKDEAVSCLRGNVYYNNIDHENSNSNFIGNTQGFITYPTLDITFAATLPEYFQNGFFSILLYYMCLLHKHSVKSITGQVVKYGNIFHVLENSGYNFKEVDLMREDFDPINKWTFANLDISKLDNSLNILRERHKDKIEDYPLLIN